VTSPVQRLAEGIVLAWGWRRLAVAALAGAVAALAMPPLGILPALAVAFPAAILLIDGSTAAPGRFAWRALRSAFAAGWAFGFGYFLAGLWWLGAAFLVETDEFIWLMPFGVLGLPAALGLFHGLGFLAARLLWSNGAGRIFAFAVAMAGAEWLRGAILTGFPWNSFGQAFGANDALAQSASLIGLDGLTLLAPLLFSTPVLLLTGRTALRRMALPVAAALVLAGMAGFGLWRLQATPVATLPDVSIRIMQPNLSQREKHRLSGQEVLNRYLALSDRATAPGASGIADATHLVWPESPFPFLLAREPQALSQIARRLTPRTVLVTGAARAEDASGAAPRYFNAIHVVNPDGVIGDSYDKVHLVPFGEYLPFRGLLDRIGLRQFVEVPGGFEPGGRRRPLTIRGLPPALPLICYEAIFPREVAADATRPGLLLNVTNDAWFGHTFGPHQHLAQARMRSIEQGLPQIRAANTGISAMIDPLGRVLRSLPLGVEGVLDSRLPEALPGTVYATYGSWLTVFLCILSFFVCIVARYL
jgi:apolipoprotein N-acyltransferase